MNSLGRGIAIILAVLVLTVVPVISMAQNQSFIADNLVDSATEEFVQRVRTNKKISVNDYEIFYNYINKTGNKYQVDITIYERNEMSDEELKDEESDSIYYEAMYSDEVFEKLYDENSINLDTGDMISLTVTLQKESVLEGLKRISPSYTEYKLSYQYGGEIR